MDAAEKTLLYKVLEGLSTSEKTESTKSEDSFFLKEPAEYLEKLKKRSKDISESININVGDILIWKDGLKNKRYPSYGQPAIVLSKIEPPLIDDDVTYNERLNIQLGFITENDEFFAFNYDGNRFKFFNK